jgi:hypothetical protein
MHQNLNFYQKTKKNVTTWAEIYLDRVTEKHRTHTASHVNPLQYKHTS